jgi:hypothetical protein
MQNSILPPLSFDRAYKTARIIYAAMFVYVFVVIGLVEIKLRPATKDVTAIFPAILSVAAICMIAALVIRSRIVGPALDQLRQDTTGSASARKWFAGSLVTFCLADAVALFGFALRMIGAGRARCSLFYIVAIAGLVIFIPQRPE